MLPGPSPLPRLIMLVELRGTHLLTSLNDRVGRAIRGRKEQGYRMRLTLPNPVVVRGGVLYHPHGVCDTSDQRASYS